jgi:type VI protein secretion system component VasK
MSIKHQAKRLQSVEPINYVLLTIAIVLLGGCTLATWFTLQSTKVRETATAEVKQEIEAAMAKDEVAPEIPELKLNKKNERLGPEVTVNPGQLGKDNPFSK